MLRLQVRHDARVQFGVVLPALNAPVEFDLQLAVAATAGHHVGELLFDCFQFGFVAHKFLSGYPIGFA